MNASYESLYSQRTADANDIPFLSVSDTAEYLGISKSKIYKDIRTGKLVAGKSSDDTTMISPRALERAYPEIDIAEIFDIEPADSPRPKPLGAVTQAAEKADETPKCSKNTSSMPKQSSLEIALEKHHAEKAAGADHKVEGQPISVSGETETETVPLKSDEIDEDYPRNIDPKPSNKWFKFVAAILVSSAILLGLLAQL